MAELSSLAEWRFAALHELDAVLHEMFEVPLGEVRDMVERLENRARDDLYGVIMRIWIKYRLQPPLHGLGTKPITPSLDATAASSAAPVNLSSSSSSATGEYLRSIPSFIRPSVSSRSTKVSLRYRQCATVGVDSVSDQDAKMSLEHFARNDVISHFLMRQVFCASERMRSWFLVLEAVLFSARVDALPMNALLECELLREANALLTGKPFVRRQSGPPAPTVTPTPPQQQQSRLPYLIARAAESGGFATAGAVVQNDPVPALHGQRLGSRRESNSEAKNGREPDGITLRVPPDERGNKTFSSSGGVDVINDDYCVLSMEDSDDEGANITMQESVREEGNQWASTADPVVSATGNDGGDGKDDNLFGAPPASSAVFPSAAYTDAHADDDADANVDADFDKAGRVVDPVSTTKEIVIVDGLKLVRRLRKQPRFREALSMDLGPEVYRMPFEFATDLVAQRSYMCILDKGFAYISRPALKGILKAVFVQNLKRDLEATYRSMQAVAVGREKVRFLDMWTRLRRRFAPKQMLNKHEFDAGSLGALANVCLPNLPALAQSCFPPCMQHLFTKLQQEQHLKNSGRLQLNLFFLSIGLPLGDAVKLWQLHLTTKKEKWKGYHYSIEHNYGKQGKCQKYSSYDCEKIRTLHSDGTATHHGCPFKQQSEDQLSLVLQTRDRLSVEETSEIIQIANAGHHQAACKAHFLLKHRTLIANNKVLQAAKKAADESNASRSATPSSSSSPSLAASSSVFAPCSSSFSVSSSSANGHKETLFEPVGVIDSPVQYFRYSVENHVYQLQLQLQQQQQQQE